MTITKMLPKLNGFASAQFGLRTRGLLLFVACGFATGCNTEITSVDSFSGTVPTNSLAMAVSAPVPAAGSLSSKFVFTVTYTGASAVNLTSGDITLDQTGVTCSTVTVADGTTNTPDVTVEDCMGNGNVEIIIAGGTASDESGNVVAAGTSDPITVTQIPFVSVWQTTGPTENVTLPLRAGYNYDMTVNWGDGSPDSVITSDSDPDRIHNYLVANTYTITITGRAEAWYFNNAGDISKIYSITDLGDLGWLSFEGAFHGCNNLAAVAGGVTSKVTNMASMFNLAAAALPDTSGWDTSNVTNMQAMFENASVAVPDTSSWDTSKVTNMAQLFRWTNSANPDVSSWDTSNVTDMNNMFRQAAAAYPDTSGFNTSKVTNMQSMFESMPGNPDTSGFDTSNVVNLMWMFYGNGTADPDTSGWDTSNVTNMRQIFYFAFSANPDVSGWDTSSATNMQGLFRFTTADPDMSGWDFSNIAFLNDIVSASGITTPNYSSLLIAIDANPPAGAHAINVGGVQYTAGAAATARGNLVGWAFTDGGQAP